MLVSSQSKQTLGLNVSSDISRFLPLHHLLVVLQRQSQLSEEVEIGTAPKCGSALFLASGRLRPPFLEGGSGVVADKVGRGQSRLLIHNIKQHQRVFETIIPVFPMFIIG